jgi:hypothetical protein
VQVGLTVEIGVMAVNTSVEIGLHAIVVKVSLDRGSYMRNAEDVAELQAADEADLLVSVQSTRHYRRVNTTGAAEDPGRR